MRILVFIALCSFLFFGCIERPVPIMELNENPSGYVGKEISVNGVVEGTFKLGKLSGYKITEGNSSISVSSQTLPAEGKEMTVRGTWMKDSIFGYYLLAKES